MTYTVEMREKEKTERWNRRYLIECDGVEGQTEIAEYDIGAEHQREFKHGAKRQRFEAEESTPHAEEKKNECGSKVDECECGPCEARG